MEFDETKKRFWEIAGNKKFQIIATVVLFAVILIWSSSIRLSNMPLLVDQTTGKNIPLALDPFYFLRISETILEQGGLPDVDVMRAQFLNKGFTQEILPQTVVFIYNLANIFGDFSIQYINVISPVIFFILGLIVFFFLVYFLTNSKLTALLSSGFLAFVPAYLYRTMAGFSDHEAIGMLAFFAVMLSFTFALKSFDKKRASWVMTCILALGTAFFTAFTIASWTGIASFVFMILPLSFFLFWIIKVKKEDDGSLKKYLIFYFIWLIFSLIFGLFFGFGFSSLINRFIISSSGLISVFVLGFIIIDYFLIRNQNKFLFLEKRRKYRVLISAGATVILGVFFLLLFGKNVFSLISEIWTRLLHPFGIDRVGLTVAENKQPYLLDWISQTGKVLFWLFFSGLIVLGLKFSKGILRNKNKIWFVFFWVLMISGILFSRISSGHLLNGENFISQVFYMGSLLIFVAYFIWVYFNDEIRTDSNLLILFSWMFFVLISGRGAIRLFFVITPFICLSAGFFVVEIFNYFKKSKEEIIKIILICILILSIVGSVYSLFTFYGSIQVQAKNTGPSTGYQWQNAGAWIRENTPENSIFIHWWDYGYWVQYLGERPTVTDGGHAASAFGDHMIGRYVLTTPNPQTALSFMKTTNVSYLLIDPTDLGKYGAYSKIGSDETGNDRYSWLPVMAVDPQQTKETSSGKILVYSGGGVVDEDIIYEENDSKIFLPAWKASFVGTIVTIKQSGNSLTFNVPEGVYLYNGNYFRIPLRYVYFNEELIDFGSGLDATIRILPSFNGNQVDSLGTAIYLSPKVSSGLFARLYLMDDPSGDYPTIKLVHSEKDPVVKSLADQGVNAGDFIYYRGFRGPIKIWKVDYPSNILTHEEFLRTSGEYADMDWRFEYGAIK